MSPVWRHVVVEPLLPAKHGEEITLTCPADLSLEGGNKATCNDGILVLSPEKVPWCLGRSLLGSRFILEVVEVAQYMLLHLGLS